MRHGRQKLVPLHEDQANNFDINLNNAVDKLSELCPGEWDTILAYIDSMALMQDISGMEELSIVKMAAEKQGAAKIFYRLKYRKRRGK